MSVNGKDEQIKDLGGELVTDNIENIKLITGEEYHQLSKEEQKRFTFQKSTFGAMNLPNSNLIVANFSLPFAKKDYWDLIWNKINN